MKELKAILILCALTIFSVNSFAQSTSIFLDGGITSTNLSGLKESKNKTGYRFGLNSTTHLTHNFVFMSGLEFIVKGAKDLNEKVDVFKSINSSYLQIPLKLGYQKEILPTLNLHVGAGPYLAYGISGKMKGSTEQENTFGKGSMKKFDTGICIETGITVLNLAQLRIGYNFGVIDVAKKDWGDKLKNRDVYVTLGIKIF